MERCSYRAGGLKRGIKLCHMYGNLSSPLKLEPLLGCAGPLDTLIGIGLADVEAEDIEAHRETCSSLRWSRDIRRDLGDC